MFSWNTLTIYYVLDLFRLLENKQRTRGKPVTSKWCANDKAVALTDNMSPLTVFSSQLVALIYFLCSLALTGWDRKRESSPLFWHQLSSIELICSVGCQQFRLRDLMRSVVERRNLSFFKHSQKTNWKKNVHWIEHSYRVCECCGRAPMLLIFGCNYSFFL